jgi:putative peptidoglycan lipid II flippase
MRKIIARANKQITVGWAAALLAGSFLTSALLGLLRERLLLANFGVGPTLDSYYIAFSIPDLIFYLLISGALSVTFIPVLSEYFTKNQRKLGWELSSSLMNLLGLSTLAASILIIIFAPWLVGIIYGGNDPAVLERATDLMRLVAVNPFLFGIASVVASMQQTVGRFFFNALSPIFYNLGIIGGTLFLAPTYGIKGVALGVGLGAIAQLLIQLVGLVGLDYHYSWRINWRHPGLKRVLLTLPARAFDQSIDRLMSIIERFLASFLFVGAITAYQTAFTLRNVPITLIGAAIATAAFPKFSALASGRPELFRATFIKVVRAIVWLSLPAASIAFIMRGYLVRLLLGSGSAVIATVLGWLTFSIVFRAVFQATTRAFYAHKDTRTPLIISAVTLVLNVALAFLLVERHGIYGLAMAQSAVAALEVLMLFVMLEKRLGRLFSWPLWADLGRMAVATTGMSVFTYLLVSRVFPLLARDAGFFALAPKFGLIVLLSAIFYVCLSTALRLRETRPIIDALSRIVFKPIRISPR